MHIKVKKKNRKYLLTLFSLILASFLIVNNLSIEAKAESKPDGIYVPIIMYHQVKPFNTGKDVITPSEFESDLRCLMDNDYSTITMSDLIDFVYDGKELPEKPIILTFDDGYYDNYVYVYPLLKKYNNKIVLSIIGKCTDDFSRTEDVNIKYSHMTWDQINEMKDSGLVEIQNHTYNLHSTSKRYGCSKINGETKEHYKQILTDDIGKLQAETLANTGTIPNTFNYPYGRYCNDSDEIIKMLGFKASLTCDYGINCVSNDTEKLYNLKRICRSHGVSIKKLLLDAEKLKK